MKCFTDDELLNNLCKEYYKGEIPNNLKTRLIYTEIENFKDAEYIYCIAYEMLIRTDEYKQLLKEHKPLKNISKDDMTNEEFSKHRELVDKMNDLGLKKSSFLCFDCGDDDYKDHVFKRIEYYDEIINNPWRSRMLCKFELDSDENIFYLLAKFYNDKGKLLKSVDGYGHELSEEEKQSAVCYIKSKSQYKTKKEYDEFCDVLNNYCIPCVVKETGKIRYKELAKGDIYLKELDKDFLLLLKEKKNSDLLRPIKLNFSYYNTGFWNKYSVNDIVNGMHKLVDFYVTHNLIYDKNGMHISNVSTDQILKNPTSFYIPCVNRMKEPEFIPVVRCNDEIPENDFHKQLKCNLHDYIILQEGSIKVKIEDGTYLINIDKYISLSYLDDSFLETLEYEDLKNKYIETEPLFSRPRLMFDEARLTNVPINLNLSKEDLLLYISQIKDDFNKNKNVIKTDEEYIFNLTLDSDSSEMPANIKRVSEDAGSKRRLFPNSRKKFKKRLATAFYIYDLYKFFLPLFEQKKKDIEEKKLNDIEKKKISRGLDNTDFEAINEIKEIAKNNTNLYNLTEKISHLVVDLSEEQVECCLSIMKEFIHGINTKEENNNFKKQYNPQKEEEQTQPKYKNLIIGDSYILKSNRSDLLTLLGL